MPTFYDPVADAEEASQALRGLAHASRQFEQPEDAYGVIGDLLGGVRSLQQSLRQLAARHTQHDGRARDDAGSLAAGIHDARQAAQELTDAATVLDAVEAHLDAASQAAGRIAWHPAPPAGNVAEAVAGDAAADTGVEGRRWVNVVFLQGGQADAVLWLIDRDGPDAAIAHLRHYDYGEETTDAAMVNGYVYDTPPTSPLDRETTSGEYTMIHNPDFGHVALYRRHHVAPENRVDPGPVNRAGPASGSAAGALATGGAAAGAAAGALGSRARRGSKTPPARKTEPSSWFAHPGVEAVKRDRGLNL